MSDLTPPAESPVESPAEAAAEPAVMAQPQWTDLPLERPTLLRLAPLPTDAVLGARPLRFVELLQAERHAPEQSLLRLVVRYPGTVSFRGHNVVEFWADHSRRSIRLGPADGIFIDLRGRGLGRFMLAQGIAWAKQRWPSYTVDQGALPSAGAQDTERLLRDHCLLGQGFSVQYPLDAKVKPFYSAASVDALNQDWNAEKVQIIPLGDAAGMLEQANDALLEQDGQIRQLQERATRYQREDGTLRFTILCLVTFSLFQAGLLIWIATR